MSWIGSVVAETLGLFVDDGSFAISIVAWLAVAGLTAPHLPLGAGAKGTLLFIGLAALLIGSAVRRSRR